MPDTLRDLQRAASYVAQLCTSVREIAAGCVLLGGHAIAADATGPVPPTGSGDSALQEIVVTANRREESINKVPISVTALSQKTMDDLHIQTFADLAYVVPGLIVPQPVTGASTDVAIRGIFSGGNAPTTQIYIDETPIAIRRLDGAGPSGSPHPDIFDLDRVEVLRGPQGTLFGSSAMGGAIRYITPQPNLETSSGVAKADFGYTDRGAPSYEVGLAYGAPIVPGTAGFRISGWAQSTGGFIDQEDPYTGQILKRNANSSDSFVIRPAFTWAPVDGLTITPALFLQHIHENEQANYWLDELPNPEKGAYATGMLVPQPLWDDLNVSSLAIKYDFSGMSFQSDTSYLDRSYRNYFDFTHATESIYGGEPFIPGVPPSYENPEENFSFTRTLQQEFRLTSQDPSSWVSWVAGAYFRRAVQDLVQYLPGDLGPVTEAVSGESSLVYTGVPDYIINGQAFNSYADFQTTDVEEAGFGEISVAITQRLKATAGVRVEHSVVEHQNEILAGPLDGVTHTNVTLPDQVGNPITPKYSLSYQYTDQGMVYVSAAKGYRAGGGNSLNTFGNPLCDGSLPALGLTSVPSSFNSDSLWSYELGVKDSLFDRRLAIQASVFHIDWSNIQTSVFIPSCSEVFTANRGKAVSQGGDLQIAAIVADGLKVSANVGYTNAYYPNAALGAPNNGVIPILNAAGDKLANVLPWTASAHAEYSLDVSPLWAEARSYISVDYRWLSAANALDPNVASFDAQAAAHQDQAYGLLNVRVGVRHGGLDVSAYVLNATNAHPIIGFSQDSNPDPLFYAAAIPPLTAGITAWYRF